MLVDERLKSTMHTSATIYCWQVYLGAYGTLPHCSLAVVKQPNPRQTYFRLKNIFRTVLYSITFFIEKFVEFRCPLFKLTKQKRYTYVNFTPIARKIVPVLAKEQPQNK